MSASMEESLDRRRTVTEARLRQVDRNRLQEGRPRTRTRCPRFRSWWPARCPAKLQRSGVPAVKLRQDLPQHVQKPVNSDETNDLHSLRGRGRGLQIDVLSAPALLTSETG